MIKWLRQGFNGLWAALAQSPVRASHQGKPEDNREQQIGQWAVVEQSVALRR